MMKDKAASWLDRNAIPEWRIAWKRFESMYVVYFWAIVGAGIMVAPLLSDELKAVVGPWTFGGVLFVAAASFAVARFKGSPGTEQ